jgi:hypothetical protein
MAAATAAKDDLSREVENAAINDATVHYIYELNSSALPETVQYRYTDCDTQYRGGNYVQRLRSKFYVD